MDLVVEIEQDFDKIKMILYTNGVMNVIFKQNSTVELRDAEEAINWTAEVAGDRKFVNLMEAESNTEVDAEARALSASNQQNKYTIADAIVISSQAHRILTNFYLKFNKPTKPTKIFNNRDKALQWLLQQKELYYQNS